MRYRKLFSSPCFLRVLLARDGPALDAGGHGSHDGAPFQLLLALLLLSPRRPASDASYDLLFAAGPRGCEQDLAAYAAHHVTKLIVRS